MRANSQNCVLFQVWLDCKFYFIFIIIKKKDKKRNIINLKSHWKVIGSLIWSVIPYQIGKSLIGPLLCIKPLLLKLGYFSLSTILQEVCEELWVNYIHINRPTIKECLCMKQCRGACFFNFKRCHVYCSCLSSAQFHWNFFPGTWHLG